MSFAHYEVVHPFVWKVPFPGFNSGPNEIFELTVIAQGKSAQTNYYTASDQYVDCYKKQLLICGVLDIKM
jgi:hypothetical protein